MHSPSQHGGSVPIHDIIRRAQDGDQAAVEDLLTRYRPLIVRSIRRVDVALQRGGQSRVIDLRDLWQEATCAFLALVHRYDPSRGVPFGGYVRTMLPWQLARVEQQNAGQVVSLPEVGEDHLVAVADAGLDAALMRDLLAYLPPRQAEILDAIYIQERDVADIAARLGIAPRAVYAARKRALATLRRWLSSEDAPRRDRRRGGS